MTFLQWYEYTRVVAATQLWKVAVEVDHKIHRRMPFRPTRATPATEMRIFVDVGSLFSNQTTSGTNRVTESVSKALSTGQYNKAKVQLVRFRPWRGGMFEVSAENVDGRLKLTSSNKKCSNYGPGDFFLGLDLSHVSTISHVKFFSRLRSAGAHVSFVLYDLLPIDYPEYFPMGYGLKRLHEKWLKVLSEADSVFPISETVAKRWDRFLIEKRITPDKRPLSKVISLGSNITSGANTGIRFDMGPLASNEFVLVVGTLEPRKRIGQVLGALELLWALGDSSWLVVAGKAGWLTSDLQIQLRDLEKNGAKVMWLYDCSDEDLTWLYSKTSLLVAASTDEGYGLPLIEGLVHQRKVLARDIPVFREVGGSSCFFFEGDTPSQLAVAISDSLARDLIKIDLKAPTWDDCSKAILDGLSDLGTKDF